MPKANVAILSVVHNTRLSVFAYSQQEVSTTLVRTKVFKVQQQLLQ